MGQGQASDNQRQVLIQGPSELLRPPSPQPAYPASLVPPRGNHSHGVCPGELSFSPSASWQTPCGPAWPARPPCVGTFLHDSFSCLCLTTPEENTSRLHLKRAGTAGIGIPSWRRLPRTMAAVSQGAHPRRERDQRHQRRRQRHRLARSRRNLAASFWSLCPC